MTELLPVLTPFDPATMIQSVDELGHGLRVVFYKLGDRWGHVVAAVAGEQITPLLVSKEGTNEQVWPPSPPLQSLSIERREKGDVALLVGMAGKAHWSASVESVKSDDAGSRLVFDIACRVSGTANDLGSTYEVASDLFSQSIPSGFELSENAGNVRTWVNCANAVHGLKSDNQIVVRPPQTKPPLIRWRYEIASLDHAVLGAVHSSM